MDEVEELAVQNLEYQKIDELFEERDSEVFDTILLNWPIETMKNKLKLLKYQGIYVHDIYSSVSPFFHGPNLEFPQIHWLMHC